MRRLWLKMALVLVILAVLSTEQVVAQGTTTVLLKPIAGSNVQGTALLTAAGDGTQVQLKVDGLPPGSPVRAMLQGGTCAAPGLSAAPLPALDADATGVATVSGPILFRGTEPVALSGLTDGEHIITVMGENGLLACGLITRFGATADTGVSATRGITPWLLTVLLLAAAVLAVGGWRWVWMRRDIAPSRR